MAARLAAPSLSARSPARPLDRSTSSRTRPAGPAARLWAVGQEPPVVQPIPNSPLPIQAHMLPASTPMRPAARAGRPTQVRQATAGPPTHSRRRQTTAVPSTTYPPVRSRPAALAAGPIPARPARAGSRPRTPSPPTAPVVVRPGGVRNRQRHRRQWRPGFLRRDRGGRRVGILFLERQLKSCHGLRLFELGRRLR